MPHPKLALTILLFSAATPSIAAGQNVPSPYRFIEHSQEWSLFAGKTDMNPGQLGLGPRDATTFGGRYSVGFAGAAAFEVHLALYQSKRTVLDVGRPVEDRLLGKSDLNAAMAHVRLRINLTGQRTWRGLQPYFAFGGGMATTTSVDRLLELEADMPGDEWFSFGPAFAAVLAAGTNFHISDKLSLTLEADMNFWKLGTPLGWLTVEANPLGEHPQEEWVASKSITLGASWRF